MNLVRQHTLDRIRWVATGCYLILFGVGFFLYDRVESLFHQVTPFFLLFLCLVSLGFDVAYTQIHDLNKRKLSLPGYYRIDRLQGRLALSLAVTKKSLLSPCSIWIYLFFTLTWWLEFLGVQYGWMFGEYTYTSRLKLFSLPGPLVI